MGIYNSSHWRALKRKAKARAQGHCERCGERLQENLPGKTSQLHHLTYERAGHETLEDVQLWCFHCHQKRHPTKALIEAVHSRKQGLWLRERRSLVVTRGLKVARRREKHMRRVLRKGHSVSPSRREEVARRELARTRRAIESGGAWGCSRTPAT